MATMLKQVKILTSRRAYEFGTDALRLSTLSIQPIQQEIQKLFGFQSSTIGTPMATFGAVPATFPPGIVFNLGAWVHQDEYIVPIRFIHFEQNRIVIDVAGPTAAIDGIAGRLFSFLSGLQAADGSSVVGEPKRIFNYSEITAQFSFPLDTIFASPLRKLFTETFNENANGEGLVLVPMLILHKQPVGQEFAGIANTNDTHSFTFTVRAGTQPEEHIYFSGVLLDSEAHLAFLTELEKILSPLSERDKKMTSSKKISNE